MLESVIHVLIIKMLHKSATPSSVKLYTIIYIQKSLACNILLAKYHIIFHAKKIRKFLPILVITLIGLLNVLPPRLRCLFEIFSSISAILSNTQQRINSEGSKALIMIHFYGTWPLIKSRLRA